MNKVDFYIYNDSKSIRLHIREAIKDLILMSQNRNQWSRLRKKYKDLDFREFNFIEGVEHE